MESLIPWIALSMLVCILATAILIEIKAASKQDKRISRMIARREYRKLNLQQEDYSNENNYKL